jgi:hypothetical protein
VAAHGLDFAGTRPKAIAALPTDLADIDIIVSLEGDPRRALGEIPFRTVALEWEVEGATAPIEEVARRIAAELQNLIELVRGEHAE